MPRPRLRRAKPLPKSDRKDARHRTGGDAPHTRRRSAPALRRRVSFLCKAHREANKDSVSPAIFKKYSAKPDFHASGSQSARAEHKNLSSVRDSIEGERSIQGFFMAYLSLNDYYITAPELELSHGYCDFFLLPNLTHYQSKHSYIVELKYLPKKDFEAKAAEQWQQAVEQIDSYARAPRVEALRQGTQMHKIVMQFSGWDLMRMEEV